MCSCLLSKKWLCIEKNIFLVGFFVCLFFSLCLLINISASSPTPTLLPPGKKTAAEPFSSSTSTSTSPSPSSVSSSLSSSEEEEKKKKRKKFKKKTKKSIKNPDAYSRSRSKQRYWSSLYLYNNPKVDRCLTFYGLHLYEKQLLQSTLLIILKGTKDNVLPMSCEWCILVIILKISDWDFYSLV